MSEHSPSVPSFCWLHSRLLCKPLYRRTAGQGTLKHNPASGDAPAELPLWSLVLVFECPADRRAGQAGKGHDPSPRCCDREQCPLVLSVRHGCDAHALGSNGVSHHRSRSVAHCDSCQGLCHGHSHRSHRSHRHSYRGHGNRWGCHPLGDGLSQSG